ncbi:hypothetical protein [Nannocystis pusilla]|uniref:Uncharacterized protein n=1 Tax=Nannocystis pusilla TaxID=889268 RepID=A0ABS7TQG5_9BACT|nr:hypothetical protein [Nannocystis pusilla]MBZ5710467.1 hypothetical protein [Nannocystis pusilla]
MSESAEYHFLDLLIDDCADGLRKVALSADNLTIQWRALPAGGLREMLDLLRDRNGDYLQLNVGRLFDDAAVFLVRRETIISFKVTSEHRPSDLVLVHLTEAMISRLEDALVDAIEDWGP